jgi:Uma2 family endonuclease
MRLLDPPQVHQWTRDEYYKMAEAGLFEGKHVELIEGRIIEMSPMGSTHATGVSLAGDSLRSVIGHGLHIRSQMPLDLGDLSEPEPDIAVVMGKARDYTNGHPKTAVLLVEVSESSLDYDRTEQASLYAAAGIPDYWVLNLIDRRLEVRRGPVPDPNELYGFGYRTVTILHEGDFVSPLAAPQTSIAVADLLP